MKVFARDLKLGDLIIGHGVIDELEIDASLVFVGYADGWRPSAGNYGNYAPFETVEIERVEQ